MSEGRYEAARDYFEQTLEISRDIGDRALQAEALSDLGLVYCSWGDYRMAQSYQAQALDLHEDMGNQPGQAEALGKFARLYYHLRNYPTTRRYCDLALALQQKLNLRPGQALSLTYLGHAQAGLGHLEAAATAYDQAAQLCREMGLAGLAMADLAGLACLALAQGQLNLALNRVEPILAWLDTHHHLAGLDDPYQVYLTVYRVLTAAAPGQTDRAQTILTAMQSLVQKQAAWFSDDTLRRKFLENAKINEP